MICYNLKNMQICEISEPTIVALGTFDGAHIGHLSVFSSCVTLARKLGAKSVVYTFSSIPKDFLSKKESRSIFTFEEKVKAIRRAGIDYLCVEDFKNIVSLTGNEFLENILVGKLNAIGATCGFNYRFGRGASCDTGAIKSFFENRGGCVQICDKILFENDALSSSLLRDFIESGDVERLLDVSQPYSVYARVEHGKELGRALEFPTINQFFPDEKVVPANGVYITECEIGEDVYPSITNVGTRPTVESDGVKNMETHIIGYSGNLYGSFIRVNFYKFLRKEKKFSSIDELVAEVKQNIEASKEYFK